MPAQPHQNLSVTDRDAGQASSGSLQHAGRRARDLLNGLRAAASEDNLPQVCTQLCRIIAEARRGCEAAGIDFDKILAEQPVLSKRPNALVAVPRDVSKNFKRAIDAHDKGGSRHAASTGSKKVILLVRRMLTLKAAGLMDLVTLPEEPPQVASRRGAAPRLVVQHDDDTQVVEPAATAPDLPAYGSLELSPNWRQQLGDPPEERQRRNTRALLDMLERAPMWAPLGETGFTIPGWRWAPTLEQVRDLYDAVLGPMRRDTTVREEIIAASPYFLDCGSRIANLWPDLDSLLSGDRTETSCGPERVRSSVFFPNALWGEAMPAEAAPYLPDWAPAVASIARKSITKSADRVAPTYSHGILRDVETAVLCGRHVLLLGAAGTGKSTVLSSLTFSGSVFELGDGRDSSFVGQNSYGVDAFDRMLTKAGRTKGRRVLLVHELVLTPAHLCSLGVFHQIVIAGDPRQPGPLPSVAHILQFMQEIEALTFTLQVVYRGRNPHMFRFNNYLAYGSVGRNFKPWHARFYGTVRERHDNSFTVLSCLPTAGMRAATMLAHAVTKIEHGRSVLIATEDEGVIAALDSLVSRLPTEPQMLEFRLLSDLQGRFADVLIVDLLECAARVPAVDAALRYWIMLCGRPRYTLAVVVPQIHMEPAQPWPLLAVASGYFMWRVRRRVEAPMGYEDLESALQAVDDHNCVERLDDQTFAVAIRDFTKFVIVKDEAQSNVATLAQDVCLLGLPELFEMSQKRAETIKRLVTLLSKYKGYFRPGIMTLEKLEAGEGRPDPKSLV